MSPEEMTNKLTQLEKQTIRLKNNDNQTKFQVVSMFRYLKKLIRYQVPTPPINVSDEGHKFECPRCGTKFETEDVVDDFNGCYICLQRWKEVKEDE